MSDPSRPTYGYGQNPPGYGASGPPGGGPGPDGPGSAPVCPRHPDRPSYVRCQRCGRPACPECQRSAPVGVQCVDCVAATRHQQRQTAPRTVVGARAARSATPYVTYTLIGLSVAGFLLQMLIPGGLLNLLVFSPATGAARPWTFFTSGFLHGGILHLLFNMYALWICGPGLERALGRWRYAALFLLSVLAGHVAVLWLTSAESMSWFTGTVGASGGVFGLFGATFVVMRKLGGQASQILVLIGLNMVISFTAANISWQGHLGGLLAGTGLAAVLLALRRTATATSDREQLARRTALVHGAVVVAAAVLLILAAVARYAVVGSGSPGIGF